jgi:hypothetical protein
LLVNFTYSWLIFHRIFKGHALKESDLERRRRFADFILTNMTGHRMFATDSVLGVMWPPRSPDFNPLDFFV